MVGCCTAGSPHSSAFERFRRGARAGGAGLGLSIVQAIAEAHGGHARVGADRRGCVVVELPNAAFNSSARVDRAHIG